MVKLYRHLSWGTNHKCSTQVALHVPEGDPQSPRDLVRHPHSPLSRSLFFIHCFFGVDRVSAAAVSPYFAINSQFGINNLLTAFLIFYTSFIKPQSDNPLGCQKKMGISLQQYRAAIGNWQVRRKRTTSEQSQSSKTQENLCTTIFKEGIYQDGQGKLHTALLCGLVIALSIIISQVIYSSSVADTKDISHPISTGTTKDFAAAT